MDYEKQPYAEFIESFVQRVFAEDVESLGVCIIRKDGTAETGYYNADATDIAVMRHNLQLDMIEQFIENNADRFKQIIEGEDPDEE